VNTLYAQPNVVEPGDFRLLERATLKVNVTNSIALKLDFEVRHDNKPPEQVEKTDYKYTTGIEYSF
jgi:putative salt-induced outer membrane protein YdiY